VADPKNLKGGGAPERRGSTPLYGRKVLYFGSQILNCKKAYGTVWRKALMLRLYKLGVKGSIWKIIDDCYIDNESAVAVNGTMSSWKYVKEAIQLLKKNEMFNQQ
jgi:hypothetical protein